MGSSCAMLEIGSKLSPHTGPVSMCSSPFALSLKEIDGTALTWPISQPKSSGTERLGHFYENAKLAQSES